MSELKKKVLTKEGLNIYDTEIKKKISEGDATTLSSAQSKIDELKNGQVATNTQDIENLKTGKADKATTLAGYGISDAYTKEQTKSEITTAVANADHLKREIVIQLPTPESANEHTIYMIKKKTPSGENAYDEYMVVNTDGAKKMEKIGDSAVDLTNYATKTEVQTAKQEAIASATQTASADATSKANKALSDAKSYSDSLAPNYATAAQGAKADTALQKASITSGSKNGAISVGGTDVSVRGLASAAYAETSQFDAAGTATTKVEELANGQVNTNKTDISTLKGRVDILEANGFEEITDEEIRALFA